MKTLKEFITIKNLNTDEVTTVDDEGNIEGLGSDGSSGGDHATRPDGSHDGLDDLLDGEFSDFGAYDDMAGMDDPLAMGEELPAGEEVPTEEEPLDGEGEFEDESGMFGEEEAPDGSDPDFQGVIRTVTGACLVYKRKTEEGTFEELWVFNVGKNMRNEVKTRRAVLAGTDIPAQGVSSEDGTQSVETTTIGNAQFLRLSGLPN